MAAIAGPPGQQSGGGNPPPGGGQNGQKALETKAANLAYLPALLELLQQLIRPSFERRVDEFLVEQGQRVEAAAEDAA